MKTLFRSLTMLMLALSACAQNTDIEREVKKLHRHTVPVLRTVPSGGRVVVLDTREREEYNVSHLPHARWVGYDDFDLQRVKDIPRQDTIIVYCSIGYRSERIGEKLLQAGYRNVYNLYGGIFHWKNTDGVVVTPAKDTTQRVHCYDRNWSRFLQKGEKVY